MIVPGVNGLADGNCCPGDCCPSTKDTAGRSIEIEPYKTGRPAADTMMAPAAAIQAATPAARAAAETPPFYDGKAAAEPIISRAPEAKSASSPKAKSQKKKKRSK